MAVIDSCEIPAKHNYNNSAAADQRAESGPGHQLPGLTLLCSCIEVETSGGEGEGEDIRRFSFGQFA